MKDLIERTLEAARKTQPDLWARTEAIARIIAPEAFLDDWIIHPSDRAHILGLRLKCQQGAAFSKAQAILQYLGVNVAADWSTILKELATSTSGEPSHE